MNRWPPAVTPAWRRRTEGEPRWPVTLAVLLGIALQQLLPDRALPRERYLLPGLELVLLIVLTVANPFRLNRESTWLRAGGLALTGLIGVSNGWSAVLVVAAWSGGAGSALASC